jgi:hypothetical protein
MAEPTEDELLAYATECPVIRGAYSTGDEAVIKRAEAYHPPKRCEYVKKARQAETQKEKAK